MSDEATATAEAPEPTAAPEASAPAGDVAAALAASDAAAPADETSVEAARRRYKVKVDGAEREVDEDELVRSYEHSKASHARMREAAAKRQSAERFAEDLADPQKFWRAAKALHGDKLDEMVLDMAGRRLEDQALPEEERAARERDRQLAEREQAIEQWEKARKEEHLSRAAEAERTRFATAIGEAIGAAGLQKSPQTVSRVAEVMRDAYADGYQMPAEEAARMVADDMRGGVTTHLGALEGQALLDAMGPEMVERFRKADVARLRASESAAKKPAAAKTAPKPKRKGPMSSSEIFEQRQREREERERREILGR